MPDRPDHGTLRGARGFRSMLFVPLMNGERADRHHQRHARRDRLVRATITSQLLQTFADQAVIAIENVRLFDEVQAKTRDLTEALTYQTGSGEHPAA